MNQKEMAHINVVDIFRQHKTFQVLPLSLFVEEFLLSCEQSAEQSIKKTIIGLTLTRKVKSLANINPFTFLPTERRKNP